MLYRKPFSVILEDAVEGEIVTELPQPLEEPELIQEIEEGGELKAVITQDSSDVEEALEEAEALTDQVIATDEVLAKTADEESNATDENTEITEEQVVTAEESFKWSLAKLGVASGYAKVVSTAQESLAEKKTRRERLKVCNEGIREFVGKLVGSIVNMLSEIINKIDLYVSKGINKMVSYNKTIIENGDKLANIKAIDPNKFRLMLRGRGGELFGLYGSFEVAKLLLTSDFNSLVNICDAYTKEKSIGEKMIKVMTKDPKETGENAIISLLKFGSHIKNGLKEILTSGELKDATKRDSFNIGNVIICGGNNLLYINAAGNKIWLGTYTFNDSIAKSNPDGNKLLKTAKATYKSFANKFTKDYTALYSAVEKTQKAAIEALKKYEDKNETKGFINSYKVRSVKSIAIDFTMLMVTSYEFAVAAYVAGIRALVKTAI